MIADRAVGQRQHDAADPWHAGRVLAGIFGLVAQGHADDYNDRRADFGRSAYRDNAESSALAADVFYSVGLATSLVGLTLVLLDGGEEDVDGDYQDELVRWPDFNLEPTVFGENASGVGVSAQGRW